MTTLQQVELQCPICETRFRSQTVVSTNSFGGKRTDFHERAAGTQPLPYLIHTCNRCGYSGADRDFTEEADVSPVLKERVWNELAPCISCGSLTGSEKYEAAAKVAEWQGMEARHVADLLLRAAWCCVDEGDDEQHENEGFLEQLDCLEPCQAFTTDRCRLGWGVRQG